MANTEEKALSGMEICAIIKVCAQNDVVKLKFNTLSLEFGRPTNPNHDDPKIDPISSEELEKAEKMAILSDEAATREKQLLQMQVENPERYEQLIADGDLEDEELSDD